ncbi:MAG: glycosyltransferase family 39 protein [Candidatus Levybacteria bacterium]|nr:glycosyltransferase family 39 protein [Candidatus Levybacteria bacterium]
MQFLKKYFGIFVVLFLSFWAIKPLFIPGFFPMHDDTQVARVFEMGKALRDGMFPVRWVPDLGYGYGYPIFNFYAPLAYYVGGLFTVLGFDALISTKIMMAVGVLLSGIFMYLLAREFWGELGGIVSSLFYIYAPYHALDIYVRGDVAEFWAYAFVPLMFWGFFKVFKEARLKYIVIGSLGYAGVILSHNLTAMMVTPFLIIVILLHCYIAYKNKKILNTYYLILTAILGLMLSSFYWIPALLEMKHTNVLSQIGGGADFRDHFVCINQLWDSPWRFGGSIPGCIDGLSFKVGKLHIIATALVMILFLFSHFFNKKVKYLNDIYHLSNGIWVIWFSIVGLLISIFLMLDVSQPIWEAIPAISFFQYPWRFSLLISFFSSLLCGSLILLLAEFKIKQFLTAVLLAIFILYFNIKLFMPQTIYQKTVNDYTSEKALKWEASKISDEFLPPDFKIPKSEAEVAKKPIPFKETYVEKVSNLVSFVGALTLIIGIIIFRAKKANQ